MNDQHSPLPQRSSDSTRYYPLVGLLAALAVGIFVDRQSAWPLPVWILFGGLSLLVWWLACKHFQELPAAVAVVALLLAVASAGAARHHLAWHLYADDEVGLTVDEQPKPVYLECVALTGPRPVPAPAYDPLRGAPVRPSLRLRVRVTAVRDGQSWRSASGLASLNIPTLPTSDPSDLSESMSNDSGDATDDAPLDQHPLPAFLNVPDIHAGDRMRIFARMSAPAAPMNPGEFDFAQHSRADGKRCLLSLKSPNCLQIIERGSWFSVRRWLEAARTRGVALLWSRLSAREAPLACAVLLGAREEIDGPRTEDFLATGTIHVLSISGMHVGILASLLFLALRGGMLPRWLAALLVAAITLGYTLLTDAEPPAVRALVMVLVVCGSICLGRRSLAFNSLALAAIVVLAINPCDLFRVGTQLSFLCVGCLAWIASRPRHQQDEDPLDKLIRVTRPWPTRMARLAAHWVWEMTQVSLLITLVTLPLTAARFHIVSPVGLLLNTLLAIPMTVAMASGFMMLTVGAVIPAVADFFGRVCDLNLQMFDHGITLADRLPGGHFWVAGPEDWWLSGFYIGLVLMALWPRYRRPLRQLLDKLRGQGDGQTAANSSSVAVESISTSRFSRMLAHPARWPVALASLWLLLGLLTSQIRSSTHEQLQCGFVSVGHGLAVLVQLPDGRTLLYDCGKMGSPNGGTQSVSSYLWSRGISHIDAIVLSHADTDHYNAVPELLQRFSVGVVYVSPIMFRDHSRALAALHAGIEIAGVPICETSSGDRLVTAGNCRIDVWHPPAAGVVGRDLDRHNANCIVLNIEYAGKRVLLTGDLEGTGLRNVMAELPCHCDVLLAPHHGSMASDPAGLAQWSTPDYVIVSNAPAFQTGKSVSLYEMSGAKVLNTADFGEIQVNIDARGIRVQTFRPLPSQIHSAN